MDRRLAPELRRGVYFLGFEAVSSLCASIHTVCMPRDKSYSGRMSVLAEVIGAIVQAVLETAGDLLFHRHPEDRQDEDSGE